MLRNPALLALVLVTALAGCDPGRGTDDAGPADSGPETDAEVDAALPLDSGPPLGVDSGSPLGVDSGYGELDSGTLLGVDSGYGELDSGTLLGVDSGYGELDAGTPLGVDSGYGELDAGTHLGVDAGVTPPVPTVIAFTRPVASVTVVEGTVRLQLVTTGPDAERVELWQDGALLVVLPMPYTYDWLSDTDPEGEHVFEARALIGGVVVATAERRFTVDRSAP